MDKKNKNWKKIINAYALKNALEHQGKAVQGAVIAGLFHEGLEKNKVKEIISEVNKIIKVVNSMELETQKKEYEKNKKLISHRKIREGLPKLNKAKKGNVVLRFAPYPSGPLHIGNARVAVLNDEYARMYKGKFILIVDDTIGSETKPIIEEAYKLIPQGLDWLEIKYQKPVIYKSDRLEIYYKYAEKLIKLNKAYVCTCKQKEFMQLKIKQIECSCRQFDKDEQLKRWKAMFSKEIKSVDAVLRLKTSMQHPNPAFRDRVLFRISDRKHPRVGSKYRVWPLLDFSWAIDDKLLGITHIIIGKDLLIESDMEKYIWDIFGWKYPEIIHTGLLKINISDESKLSKSKSQKEVESGKFIGWDDPRTWSLQSLEKRGIKARALKEFLVSYGIKASETEADVEILYAKNRELVHKEAGKIEFEKLSKKTKEANVKVLMPDGNYIYGKIKLDKKLKENKVYHLLKFGYCNLVKIGKTNEFWFAHP